VFASIYMQIFAHVIFVAVAVWLQDFGIWERGDKMNHGVPELNATSIGMAKVSVDFVLVFCHKVWDKAASCNISCYC